jgi:phospholipid/cholesterol/gamma-HCH transport system substrate-binding protein
MKKISHEVKVGVVALLTIVAFIWLYNFLKGKDFFKSTAYYYSIYDKIGGLAESSPVEINGYKVGVVQSIDFVDETSGRLLITFSVSEGFKLPVNTVAEIVPVSVIAGMKVQFVYGDGPGTYSEGDTIPGRLSESLLSSFEEKFTPLKNKIDDLLNVLDSVISSVNDVMDPAFKKNLAGTVENLNSTTESLDNVISAKEKELKLAIENISKFSRMLSDNSGKIGETIGNLESITDTLASADLYASVTNLKSSLEKTSVLLGNLNDGKGTAGQLVTNDTLYNNLSSSLESLNELLKDIKANPKKYVHFSLFGKKSSAVN